MNLTSQDEAFWSDTNLEDDKYGAHVMKYRDPKYYCGKGNTTNQMVPSALIPKPANDSLGSGTSVLFPDVQCQQVELWPLSATGDDLGMPLIVYPVSDFLRTNEKLYCYFNKLLIQFFIDAYGNAITDVHSTYLENGSSVGTWTSTSAASKFEITNIEWHLMTYTMADENLNKVEVGGEFSTSDPIITINDQATGSVDSGFMSMLSDKNYAGLYREGNSGEFALITECPITNNQVTLSSTGFASLNTGNIYCPVVTLVGSSMTGSIGSEFEWNSINFT